ncbi:MAG: DUF2304 domain-containing protein [Firmicutes bacterium]|nr:DUF2304 domain-containing protein [Bacillota bacterium]
MEPTLQIIFILASAAYTSFIVYMISRGRMDLKYSLTWLFSGIAFLTLSIFPKLLDALSRLLHIQSPVNTLFLVIIFCLLLIVLTLTVAFSRMKKQVIAVTQELALLKDKEKNS